MNGSLIKMIKHRKLKLNYMVIDVDVSAEKAKPLEIGGRAYSQGENVRHTLLWEKSHKYRQSMTLI